MMKRSLPYMAARVVRPFFRACACIVGTALLLVSFAAHAEQGQVSLGAADNTGTSSVREAYFEITAYYSPLPDQQYYVTGSYESDMRLNGRGVRGADGTPVYAGMIAAPTLYAFGTKMHIPGVGTVAVHDRGGAIVTAGKSLTYDRLDIWMGHGDEGLTRALAWGRRVLKVTVYGVDSSIIEEVSFKNLILLEEGRRTSAKPPMFSKDIWNLSHGDEVVKLQKTLVSLGYFESPVNGYYGPETRDAVYRFQKDHDIFTDEHELGAGHTGPQTRVLLEKAFIERRKSLIPSVYLGRGSQGQNVSKLQQILKALGYDVSITGVFDKQTEGALFSFQRDRKIVMKERDKGAGYFGYRTMAALEKSYIDSVLHDKTIAVIEVPDYLVQDLSTDSTGEAVRQLQTELRKLNFLRIEPTGNYGSVTAHAVFKFQQSQGLVSSLQDDGAQVFGPATRERLNQIIAERFYHYRLIAEKRKPPSLVSLAR